MIRHILLAAGCFLSYRLQLPADKPFLVDYLVPPLFFTFCNGWVRFAFDWKAKLNFLKRIIHAFVNRFGWELTKNEHNFPQLYHSVALSTPNRPSRGYVLLSYVLEPFVSKNPDRLNAHTHYWESSQIARTFLNLGYDVDVIDYRNARFIPRKKYAFFVGARTNFQRISDLVNQDCIKIVHLDMAHWLYNNQAAYQRLWAFLKKKGIALTNIKFQEVNWAVESCDYATVLGNEFTIDTYRFANKPMYRVPISTCGTYPPPKEKDFSGCKRNFLWMGSHGFVHKGLDLVLDAFVDMPDCHLYVCGPLEKEKDFVEAYYEELYRTPNIHAVGWVDVTSTDFMDLANQCVAIVYPSCAEGGGGSVINCMHAGLIPIASFESSVDVEDVGIVLQESTVSKIQEALRTISLLSNEALLDRSMRTWKFARDHHTRGSFARGYQRVIQEILEKR